jgi:hypothetical protein
MGGASSDAGHRRYVLDCQNLLFLAPTETFRPSRLSEASARNVSSGRPEEIGREHGKSCSQPRACGSFF